MAKTSGRQVEVGIGIETTPGTAVAAADFIKWDSLSIQSMAEKQLLRSARGIRNEASNSIIMRKYGKGDIEFVPTVDIMPYILGLALGTRSSGTHSGESAVYDHTFTIQNANASMKTATLLLKQGGVQTERYTNCAIDTLDLTIDRDFAKCKVGFLCAYPDSSTASPSYTQDTLFSRNQMTATFGTSLSNAVGTFASTTLTSDATAPADGATITVGTLTGPSIVYTAKTALTNNGNTPYEVLIGGTAANFLINLKKCVNQTGTAGTDYGASTPAHPDVIATTITTTTLLFVSKVSGTTPNALVTTQAGTSHCSWAGGTFASGTAGTGANATALVNFSLSLKNNIQLENAFLSGSTTPVAGGFVAGPLTLTGSYTLQFSDVVELAKYQANTKSALVVNMVGAAIGTVATSELLQFKFGRLVLTKEPIEYKLDDLTFIKQEFEVEYDATDKEITAVVTNTYVGTNYQ